MKPLTMLCALLLCTVAQAQTRLEMFPEAAPVRLELFPAAEPVRLEMFPAAAPVELKLFPENKAIRSVALVPPPIDGPAAELPIVWVYGLPNCGKDRAVLAEYRAAVAAGQVLPFVMKSRAAPEWVTWCPTVHYPAASGSTGWRKLEGDWPGLPAFVKLFQAANPGRQPVRRAEVEPLSTRDLIRGLPPVQHVPVYGDIRAHIREHGFSGLLDGLSYHELSLLHDGIHAGLIQPGRFPVRSGDRSRANGPMYRTVQHGRIRPKQMDPFIVISVIGLVWNVGTFLFTHCPCNR